MLQLLIAVLGASLVGSLHCAGMCGGLVAFTCGSSQRPGLAQASYHLVRLATYLCLGALAGWAGGTLNDAGQMIGLQHSAALVSGLLMMAWALWALLGLTRKRPTLLRLERRASQATNSGGSSLASRILARIHRLPSAARGGALGLASGLLPCGWLYAFVATAAGQASVWGGLLVLAAFWAGTVPVLVGMGSVIGLLGARLRRYVPTISAVVLLLLGAGNVFAREALTSRLIGSPLRAWSATPHAPAPACHAH